jgi:hypothetical protein
MARICKDITETIGNTPLVQSNRITRNIPAWIADALHV